MRFQDSIFTITWLLSLLLALPVFAGKGEQPPAAATEEFFIVSSVDAKKQQLVLKRPTEVTELVSVSEKTVYLDEEGKPLQLRDLRAGDTIYVASSRSAGRARIASRIRKGPMTKEELWRRYLKFD